MILQAFAVYFAHLDELWQFHTSFCALIVLEAALLVSWFALETQPEVPLLVKLGSLVVLGTTLFLIFWVSEMYLDSLNPYTKPIFLLAIFCRCLIGSDIGYQLSVSFTQRNTDSPFVRTVWNPSSSDTIANVRKTAQKNQLHYDINDMIFRAKLEDKHNEALQEVNQLKEQLKKKAYAKHYLSLAQINARLSGDVQEATSQKTVGTQACT